MTQYSFGQPKIEQTLLPGARVHISGGGQATGLITLASEHHLVCVDTVTDQGCDALIMVNPGAATFEQQQAARFGKPVYSVQEFLNWAGGNHIARQDPTVMGQTLPAGPFMGFTNDSALPAELQKFAPPTQSAQLAAPAPALDWRQAPPPSVHQSYAGHYEPSTPNPMDQDFNNPYGYSPEFPQIEASKRPLGFHAWMTAISAFLLIGPFAIGVIMEMADIDATPFIPVILIAWLILIVLIPIWITLGVKNSRNRKLQQTSPQEMSHYSGYDQGYGL